MTKFYFVPLLIFSSLPMLVRTGLADAAWVEQLCAKAETAARQSKYDDAVALYRQAVRESGNDPAIIISYVGYVTGIPVSFKTMITFPYEETIKECVALYQKAEKKGARDMVVCRKIGDHMRDSSSYTERDALDWYQKSIDIGEEELRQAVQNNNTTKASLIKQELFESKAAIIWNHEENGEFEKAIDLSRDLKRLYPGLSSALLNNADYFAGIWLALESFGSGDFTTAKKRFDALAEDISRRSPGMLKELNMFRGYLSERMALGAMLPEYTQKVLVVMVEETGFEYLVPNRISKDDFENQILPNIRDDEKKIFIDNYTINGVRTSYVLKPAKVDNSGCDPSRDYAITATLKKIRYKSSDIKTYAASRLRPSDVRRAMIMFSVFGRFIEIVSRGRLSLEFRYEYLKARQTGFLEGAWTYQFDPAAIRPYPSELLFNALQSSDAVFYLYATRCFNASINHGGVKSLPIIPNVLDAPTRGFCEFTWVTVSRPNEFWVSAHEYFHIVEATWGIKPVHGQFHPSSFPEWKRSKFENIDLNYVRFHFGITIPRKIEEMRKKGDASGWKHFGWSLRKPFAWNKEKFRYLLSQSEKVSIDDRSESHDYLERARQAWHKGSKELADSFYRKALDANKACYDAYRHFGDRARAAGNYKESLNYYEEYLKFTDSASCAAKAGHVLVKNLEKYGDGLDYYKKALEWENDPIKKIKTSRDAGNNLLSKKQYDDAVKMFDKGIVKETIKESLECLFLKGESIYKCGDKEQGISIMKSAIAKGLADNKWKKRFDKMNK